MKFLLFFLTLFLTGTVNEPDGNVPLHEKTETRMPDYSTEKGYFDDVRTEPVVTWVFEEGTFVPAAKLTEKEQYSIVTNYLGTPEAMYRDDGEAVWTCELNSYGRVRNFQGQSKTDCPFRYQGQYEKLSKIHLPHIAVHQIIKCCKKAKSIFSNSDLCTPNFRFVKGSGLYLRRR